MVTANAHSVSLILLQYNSFSLYLHHFESKYINICRSYNASFKSRADFTFGIEIIKHLSVHMKQKMAACSGTKLVPVMMVPTQRYRLCDRIIALDSKQLLVKSIANPVFGKVR